MIVYRKGNIDDLKSVSRFTDFWISGRGKRVNEPGAVDDCFISPSQHKKYICKYRTFLCLNGSTIIGWAVVEPSNTLIHLLVAGNRRGEGIGSMLVKLIEPRCIRSKSDQSSGNPESFYLKLGYRKVCSERSRSRLDIDKVKPDRVVNIDVFVR